MQTFLPYPDFVRSLELLDPERLRKQRVEGQQLLMVLLELKFKINRFETLTGTMITRETVPVVKDDLPLAYSTHPVADMWRGFEHALLTYTATACAICITRGWDDSVLLTLMQIRKYLPDKRFEYPHWFGNEVFHNAHRSKLMDKDPAYYTPLFDSHTLRVKEYYWPGHLKPDIQLGTEVDDHG